MMLSRMLEMNKSVVPKKGLRARLDFKLLRNVFFAASMQLGNYGFSLVTIPLLAHILAVSGYGILAVATSVNAYLWLMIDWGFSIGANREAARALGNIEKLGEVYVETVYAKILIGFLSSIIFIILGVLGIIPEFNYIVISVLLTILGSILSADWFFQGIEEMGVVAAVTFCCRAISVLCMAIFIRDKNDIALACSFQGLSSCLAGVAGSLVAMRRVQRRKLPTIGNTIRRIIDYRHYFLSQSAWVLYASAAPIVLVLVSNNVTVGLFSGAEKITRLIVMLISPVATALYPRVNALMAASRLRAAELSGLASVVFFAYGMLMALLLIVFAPLIVRIILGVSFLPAVTSLRIMAFFPVLVGVNGVFSNQFLIPLGHRQVVSKISVFTGLFYVIALCFLGYRFGSEGAAVSLVAAESLSLFISVTALLRLDANYFLMAFAWWSARGLLGGNREG